MASRPLKEGFTRRIEGAYFGALVLGQEGIRHAGDSPGQAGALAGLEHDDGHQDQRTQYLNHRDYQIHCFHRSFQSPVGRLLQSPSRHLDAD